MKKTWALALCAAALLAGCGESDEEKYAKAVNGAVEKAGAAILASDDDNRQAAALDTLAKDLADVEKVPVKAQHNALVSAVQDTADATRNHQPIAVNQKRIATILDSINRGL